MKDKMVLYAVLTAKWVLDYVFLLFLSLCAGVMTSALIQVYLVDIEREAVAAVVFVLTITWAWVIDNNLKD